MQRRTMLKIIAFSPGLAVLPRKSTEQDKIEWQFATPNTEQLYFHWKPTNCNRVFAVPISGYARVYNLLYYPKLQAACFDLKDYSLNRSRRYKECRYTRYAIFVDVEGNILFDANLQGFLPIWGANDCVAAFTKSNTTNEVQTGAFSTPFIISNGKII